MSQPVVFDDTFTREIDALRERENIKGLAVTVIKRDGSVEMLTRGVSSEQGDPVTYNVYISTISFPCTY